MYEASDRYFGSKGGYGNRAELVKGRFFNEKKIFEIRISLKEILVSL